MKRRRAVSMVSLVVAALALVAAGCGGSTADSSGGDSSQMSPGKALFQTVGCSNCHTLADADAKGQVGPNLDYERPSEAVVAAKVRGGGGGMPSFSGQLSPDQIRTVAAYVASVAGK